MTRRYSAPSQGALSQLAAVEAEVVAVEERVRELATLDAASEEHRGRIRTELAQLEATAHKIECQGVDNVYTGELESGKAEAKEFKRSLLARLEKIFEVVDETFKRLKAAEAAG